MMTTTERELVVFRKLAETRTEMDDELQRAGVRLERAVARHRHQVHAAEGAGLHILFAMMVATASVALAAWPGLVLASVWLVVGVRAALDQGPQQRPVVRDAVAARREVRALLGPRLRGSARRSVALRGELSLPTEGVSFVSRDVSDTGMRVRLSTDDPPTWLTLGRRAQISFRGPLGPGAHREVQVVWSSWTPDGVDVGLAFADAARPGAGAAASARSAQPR